MHPTDLTPRTASDSPARPAPPEGSRDAQAALPRRRQEGLRNVLVATDFSAGAFAAVERAARLPLSPGSTLHVAHVLSEPASSTEGEEAELAARRPLEEIANRARDVARGAGNEDLRVAPSVLAGREFIEIIRHARSQGAELIVLGRHGKRRLRDLLLGSTAELTVRHADTPVLVVQQDPLRPYCRPMVAVELSDVALRSAALATKVMDPRVSSVRVIHAYRVPQESRMSLELRSAELLAYRAKYRQEARAGLQRLLDSTPFTELGVTWEPAVRSGDPRRVIVREAKRHGADLIVMGTQARSGIARALLGSVAESLMRSAPCDVLIARPSSFVLELP